MSPRDIIKSIIKADPNKIGIYMIYCAANDKAYIGQSIKISRRFIEHKSKLRLGEHRNHHLQNIWNKYGEQTILFIAIENCDEEDLTDREIYYVSLLSADCRLNLAGITERFKASDETREKIRQANLGKKATPETKLKLSKIHTGSRRSTETKLKMRESALKYIEGKKKMKNLQNKEGA